MFSLENEKKWIIRTLLVTELVFLTVLIISVFRYDNSALLGKLQKFTNDDVKYIRSGWTFLDKGMISYENTVEPTVYIMPGLTYSLSFFMMIFGRIGGITAFKVFQSFLEAGSLYLIFLIGRKVFSSEVGITALIIDALYAVEIYVPNQVLMECTFKFLLLLLLYISIFAVERKSMRLYAAGGIVWGISCLFRPTSVIYPLVILIVWIKKRYKISEMVKFTAVVLGIFCIIMIPWWVRNYRDFRMVIPFTKSSGNPFLLGTFINYDQSAGWGVPYVKGKNAIDSNQNEINEGIQRLKKYAEKEPMKYILWYTVGKIYYLWKDPFYWKSFFNITYISVCNLHLVVLVLGIIGAVTGLKNNINSLFLIGTVVSFSLLYLPFYTFERYAYPYMPLVIIFAAAALSKFKGSVINRNGKEHCFSS